MRFFTDLWTVLKGDGIMLDQEEAAALGAPAGETISLWMAMKARHGKALAHVVCLALFVVQWRHCHDQLAGVPMQPVNYLVAFILLLLFAPIASLVWALRYLFKPVPIILLASSVAMLAAAFLILGAAKGAASFLFIFSR